MTKRRVIDLAASVRNRLLAISRERGQQFEYTLTRYAIERFLYRLSKSQYAGNFVLKGANLFNLWLGSEHRPTRDIDLLGHTEASRDNLLRIISQICATDVEDDGLRFDTSSMTVSEIREQQDYGGYRVRLTARLGSAKTTCPLDIAFGDTVTPPPQEVDYPTLLDFPSPRLKCYPKESVVAEKLQALVVLGMVNSRMKDYHDLWTMSRELEFDGAELVKAIEATFRTRKTTLPGEEPVGLTNEFGHDAAKIGQWKAFVANYHLETHGADLPLVVAGLRAFLLPPLLAARKAEDFRDRWARGGPWKAQSI